MKNNTLSKDQEAHLAKAIAEAVREALNHNRDAKLEAVPAAPGFVLKADIARMALKTPRTIEAWAAKGWIPSLRVGRSRLYCPQAVRKALIERFGIGMTSENN